MVKKIAVIGGSGLEDLASGQRNEHVSRETGNRFQYYLTQVEELEVVFFPRHGIDHQNLPLDVPYLDMFRVFETERVEAILAFSATGTLDQRVPLADKKSFVVPHDFMRGYGYRPVSARCKDNPHADLSEPFHPAIRNAIIDSGRKLGYTMCEKGIYILNEGNGFETRAEIAFQNAVLHYPLIIGILKDIALNSEHREALSALDFPGMGHLDYNGAQVGMTAPKEAILAAEYKIPYAVVACPVNLASGIAEEGLSHTNTLEIIEKSKPYIKELASKTIEKLGRVKF